MIGNPEIFGHALQAQPVLLAVAREEMGMRRAQDDVHHFRMPKDDVRQRLDGVLDALAGTDEAEREEHRAVGQSELGLGTARVGELQVRDAVRNHVDCVGGGSVHLPEDGCALLRHDDDAVASFQEPECDTSLVGIRALEDGVHRCDHRHSHLVQKREDVASGRTAIDAEFVLNAEQLDVVEVQEVRCPPVGLGVPLLDLESDTIGIPVSLGPIRHRDDQAFRSKRLRCGRFAKVVCEGCDPAEPGRIVAEEGDGARQVCVLHQSLL